MFAQIDGHGYCFAVSDFNAPGSIPVHDASVLDMIWDGAEWQESPQSEPAVEPDRIAQVAASVDELTAKVDLLGTLQMQQLLSTVEGGGVNADQGNA